MRTTISCHNEKIKKLKILHGANVIYFFLSYHRDCYRDGKIAALRRILSLAEFSTVVSIDDDSSVYLLW